MGSSQGFLSCGCKFSHVAASFQLADSTRDKMKSCHHKTYRHLILNWFRSGGNDLIGRRRGIQRQGETNRQKSLWIENAARHRNRPVSPDGVHPARAEIYPQILLRRLFQRAVSANGKKGTKTAKAELAARGKSHPCTFSTYKTSVLSECRALATASCGVNTQCIHGLRGQRSLPWRLAKAYRLTTSHGVRMASNRGGNRDRLRLATGSGSAN